MALLPCFLGKKASSIKILSEIIESQHFALKFYASAQLSSSIPSPFLISTLEGNIIRDSGVLVNPLK